MKKIYRGVLSPDDANVVEVRLKGKWHPLAMHHAITTPVGFAWGYAGTQPAQLAMSLLGDCLGDSVAFNHWENFMDEQVRHWGATWQLTEDDVREWFDRQGRETGRPR